MSKRIWNVSSLCRIVKRLHPSKIHIFVVQVRAYKASEWLDVWPDDPAFSLAYAFQQVSHLNSLVLNGGENQ